MSTSDQRTQESCEWDVAQEQYAGSELDEAGDWGDYGFWAPLHSYATCPSLFVQPVYHVLPVQGDTALQTQQLLMHVTASLCQHRDISQKNILPGIHEPFSVGTAETTNRHPRVLESALSIKPDPVYLSGVNIYSTRYTLSSYTLSCRRCQWCRGGNEGSSADSTAQEAAAYRETKTCAEHPAPSREAPDSRLKHRGARSSAFASRCSRVSSGLRAALEAAITAGSSPSILSHRHA